MTWTYFPNLARPADEVRLLIGDNDTTDQQLSDEEIGALILIEGDATRAAVSAAEALAAKFSRQVSFSVGRDIQEAASQRMTQYLKLADRLRRRLARTGVIPTAGGLTVSGKLLAVSDTDRVAPVFYRDEDTEPGTESESLNAAPDYYPPF